MVATPPFIFIEAETYCAPEGMKDCRRHRLQRYRFVLIWSLPFRQRVPPVRRRSAFRAGSRRSGAASCWNSSGWPSHINNDSKTFSFFVSKCWLKRSQSVANSRWAAGVVDAAVTTVIKWAVFSLFNGGTWLLCGVESESQHSGHSLW